MQLVNSRKSQPSGRKSMRRLCVSLGFVIAFIPSLPIAAESDVFDNAEGHVVWVDFWASWCAPCRRSFPWMNAMQRKYSSQGLKIIAVNVDADRSSAETFLDEMPAEFSLEFDPAGKLAQKFSVRAMPSSFLLDESGNILQTHLGFKLADRERYEREIITALAARKATSSPQ